jgi:hypothetical protein
MAKKKFYFFTWGPPALFNFDYYLWISNCMMWVAEMEGLRTQVEFVFRNEILFYSNKWDLGIRVRT